MYIVKLYMKKMLVYTFDRTLDGVLSAVFDAFSLHQRPDALIGKGEPLPLFLVVPVGQAITSVTHHRRLHGQVLQLFRL